MIYAGYIEHEPWGVSRRKGHHEPIISLTTFEKIQERKNARPIAAAKQNIHEDFPLRGALNCACCNQPMTACWSRSGTGKRYPYYWCQTRDCSQYRKSIRAEKIDAGFEELLKGLTPSQNLLSIVTSMLSDAWDQRAAQRDNGKVQIKRDIAQLDKQQDALLEKLVDATNAKVVTAYESKIAKLEDEKLLLSDKLTQNSKPRYSKAEIFELLQTFLSSPWNIWEKGNLLLRKNVLRMALKEPLAYDRESGFRTPQVSDIFDFLADFTSKCKMVPKERLELSRCYHRGILNPLRLPFRHLGMARFLDKLWGEVQREKHIFAQKAQK